MGLSGRKETQFRGKALAVGIGTETHTQSRRQQEVPA
jgi:hypothetical protein